MMSEDQQTQAVAGWFDSSGQQLFSWVHLPLAGCAKAGVVICPPLLQERYAAHVTLRQLAEELAERDVASLRFDYRGTGDSTGHPEELASIDVWVDDIRAGVRQLRAAGLDFVAVVGMRLGANLVARDPDACGADAVVLWDPFTNGRTFLRYSTFVQRSAIEIEASRAAYPGRASFENEAEQAPALLGNAPLGYAFPLSFIESLETLGRPSTTNRPTLVLTRAGREFRANGPTDQVEIGIAEGQRELLEVELDQAKIPETSLARVRDWLCERAQLHPTKLVYTFLQSTLEVDSEDGRYREQPGRIGNLGGMGLFAIRTDPLALRIPDACDFESIQPEPLTVIFFSPSSQHHIGPNRLYVDLARRLAAEGISSIRLDFSGLGDSPVRPPYQAGVVYSPAILDDIDEIMDHTGSGPKAVVGLCSGGYHALEAGFRHKLRGVLAIHSPLLMWHLSRDPALRSSKRAIWVADRPWQVMMQRFWLGRAILWRIPGPGWWLLNLLHLQTDISEGVRRSIVNGANVVMIAENSFLRLRRAWPMTHWRRAKPIVIRSDADHSLLDASGRATVAEQAFRILTGWTDQPAATVHEATPAPV